MSHRPTERLVKRLKLTPLQNRILWILREAGEESLGTIRATLVSEGIGDEPGVSTALDGLARLGLTSQIDSAVILTERGHAEIAR